LSVVGARHRRRIAGEKPGERQMMIYWIFWGIAVPALILALLDWWIDRKKNRSKNGPYVPE
jgi:hypothetical protein